jgi:hypothetical protein
MSQSVEDDVACHFCGIVVITTAIVVVAVVVGGMSDMDCHFITLPCPCVSANNTNTYRAKIENRIMHENKYYVGIVLGK